MKRAFDLFWTIAGLAVIWPLFALLAALISLEDRGPVFYRQVRIGRHARPFRIWKFRTMVQDADRQGPLLTVGSDSRITRVGFWLRKLKLDEIPQLLNVLSGEMSLVGPRPEVARYVALYTEQQRRVLELVPGITDVASIEFRHENELLGQADDPERTYCEEIVPAKIGLNLAYAARATVATDFLIVLRTFGCLLYRNPAKLDQEESEFPGKISTDKFRRAA